MGAAEATGIDGHVHHDAVFDGDTPSFVGLGLFLLGWLIMVAAMMLPATLPALGGLTPGSAAPAVLGGFLAVWATAGAGALGLDLALHRLVAGLPALEARPWVVAAALLGTAGVVQLAPSTRRQLMATARCEAGGRTKHAPFRAGRDQGARCLRADGPLMIVMFAVGAGLGWMVLSALVMVAERSALTGSHVAVATGVALVAAAALAVLNPGWLPGSMGAEAGAARP